ncbi:MAG TPA: flagellar biosynthetic protein FliO [Capillimicrobium sp.]|nr:flagellar biosynthetic protein FliO [Capillimicrobium sp.]
MHLPSLRRAATAASAFLLVAPAYAFAGPRADAPDPKDFGESTPLNLPSDDPQALDTTGGSSGGSLVRTFVGLAIVIAVIYGLAWVLRQVKASKEERGRGHGLSTAAVLPLGPGRSLHLVRAGRELVLVGVGEHGVVPIRSYSEEEAARLGLDLGEGADEPAEPEQRGGRPKPPTIAAFLDALRERTVR